MSVKEYTKNKTNYSKVACSNFFLTWQDVNCAVAFGFVERLGEHVCEMKTEFFGDFRFGYIRGYLQIGHFCC